MRWDNLFDDLASQLEREMSADEVDVGVEEERMRLSRLTVRDRLVALLAGDPAHRSVSLVLRPDERVRVVPETVGRDWMSAELVDDGSRPRNCIIPLASIVGVALEEHHIAQSLQPPPSASSVPALTDRLSLAFVLRDLGRRRAAVDVTLSAGTIHGTIDRVGRDHFDLAVHDRGEPRRNSAVRMYRLVPFAELAWLAL